MRVLVVDDSRVLRTLLRLWLRQSGVKVREIVEATSGAEALEQLSGPDFDLILCDYSMPEMDGAEFLQEARERLEKMPRVLVVSAQSGPEIGTLVRRVGSNGFLRKPFDHQQLRHAIDMVMAGAA